MYGYMDQLDLVVSDYRREREGAAEEYRMSRRARRRALRLDRMTRRGGRGWFSRLRPRPSLRPVHLSQP